MAQPIGGYLASSEPVATGRIIWEYGLMLAAPAAMIVGSIFILRGVLLRPGVILIGAACPILKALVGINVSEIASTSQGMFVIARSYFVCGRQSFPFPEQRASTPPHTSYREGLPEETLLAERRGNRTAMNDRGEHRLPSYHHFSFL